jgi:hypothetical protein
MPKQQQAEQKSEENPEVDNSLRRLKIQDAIYC